MIKHRKKLDGNLILDYYQMTAPCGLDCFNCTSFLAHEDQGGNEAV
jgi:hypothetical protein